MSFFSLIRCPWALFTFYGLAQLTIYLEKRIWKCRPRFPCLLDSVESKRRKSKNQAGFGTLGMLMIRTPIQKAQCWWYSGLRGSVMALFKYLPNENMVKGETACHTRGPSTSQRGHWDEDWKALMALSLTELVNSEPSAEVYHSNTWAGKHCVALQKVPWEDDVIF